MNQTTKEYFLYLLMLGLNDLDNIVQQEEAVAALKKIQKGNYYVDDNVSETKVRAEQTAFANKVRTNYGKLCAISNISAREFLRASHIVPWSKDKFNRLNPQNGICFCVLHDAAFDKGFITIDYQLKIKLGKNIEIDVNLFNLLSPLAGQKLNQPKKDKPAYEFIHYHQNKIFDK